MIYKELIIDFRKGEAMSDTIKSEIFVQYRQNEAEMDAVVKRIKEQYVRKGHTEEDIETLQVYVKPEDYAAYYVINDIEVGKVELFK